MIQTKTVSKIARWILGVFLLVGMFCPCRWFPPHSQSPHAIERFCCPTCEDEQRSDQEDSGSIPETCESGCCSSCLTPERGGNWSLDHATTFLSVICVVPLVESLVAFCKLAPYPLLPLASPPIYKGCPFPNLGSLLI